MANPEHVKILKQRVDVWNRWREKNPDVEPDLIGANLSGTNLSGADLSDIDLSKANLIEANLIEANLIGANLNGANLRKANLNGTDLHNADLRKADLRGAALILANLIRANLSDANLKDAICLETIFVSVDFSRTEGLDIVNHWGKSFIGIDTLYKSKGKIPEAFLRGCGVPDQMIEYVKSLTGSPIEYYSCFISYSSKDDEFAKRLYNDLQANNVRCWLACEDMKIGDKIRLTIEESIRLHDKLLLILSEQSVKSKWVRHEVEKALDLEIEREKTVLFPVRVDDCVMDSEAGWANEIKNTRHIGDFTRWKDHDAYKEAFDRLLRDLKA